MKQKPRAEGAIDIRLSSRNCATDEHRPNRVPAPRLAVRNVNRDCAQQRGGIQKCLPLRSMGVKCGRSTLPVHRQRSRVRTDHFHQMRIFGVSIDA